MIMKPSGSEETVVRFSILQQKFFCCILGSVSNAREVKLASPAQAIRQTRQGHDSAETTDNFFEVCPYKYYS